MASSDEMEKVSLAMSKASVQVVAVGEDAKTKIDRHCAFCLTLVPGDEVKLCSKCKRRAYCSKGCQEADWKLSKNGPTSNGKIHGFGQGHKNWCGLEYGEEDLDWKVAPVEGKGLGLVALRGLPPLYRIMVDGMQAEAVIGHDGRYRPYHPGMNDLAPLSTTNIRKKFDLNAIDTGKYATAKVGLRFSRTNHSCDPNACCADDFEYEVLILCSVREIKKGEEICFPYVRFSDIGRKIRPDYQGQPPAFFRYVLFTSWGINCPHSCSCRDEEKFEMLKTCRELYEECQRNFRNKSVFHKMEKIIEIAGKLGCTNIENLHLNAAEFGITRQTTLEKAKDYLGMYLNYNKAVYHPNNKSEVKEWESALKDVSTLRGYLALEKADEIGKAL